MSERERAALYSTAAHVLAQLLVHDRVDYIALSKELERIEPRTDVANSMRRNTSHHVLVANPHCLVDLEEGR